MKESAGARLKKIRLEKGISLEEVHKATKIHPNILKAIEEDSVMNLNTIYIKGFLKIYCKFLGVDPGDYIPDYKEFQSTLKHTPDKIKTEEQPVSSPQGYFSRLTFFLPRIKIKTVFIVLLIGVSVIGLFRLGKGLSSRRRDLSARTSPPVTAPPKTEKKAAQSKLQKVPQAATIRLGIHTRENCFVKLKADGRVVFQGILRKGAAESWQANKKMELSLGNVGVVELEVNGQRFTNLGRRGEARKNIVITKEGLNIER
ncbi:MAG: RodZ domain-containing protein [Candidatus Omnitrophota bacterium]|jgi:cytoskeletal protein RodZ